MTDDLRAILIAHPEAADLVLTTMEARQALSNARARDNYSPATKARIAKLTAEVAGYETRLAAL
ncbi:MAG: hypothetical protein MUF00_01545 [Gemmatimonadaceae bacterium]|jgi:hypothetical protein|nr:hypothetical protein [Gemmatimonadaceae bacterium]